MKQKRFFLPENEIPTCWYNVQADMPVKPMPMLNPKTKEPVTVKDLSELFCQECSRQELNQTDRWIDIPEEVRERYANYRCTPLVSHFISGAGISISMSRSGSCDDDVFTVTSRCFIGMIES